MFSGRHGWKEESTIKAPWEDVMQSVQNKYPNPHNNTVLNIDVVSRKIDEQSGVLHSLRLINSSLPVCSNVGQLKALEWSAIDGNEKRMVAVTHNMDIRGVLKAVEHMEYSVHPENDRWTLIKHSVSVEAFPLIALTAASASRQAATQGREALKWVMKHRLPLLHSYPHWNINFSQSDLIKTVSDQPTVENPSMPSSSLQPTVIPMSPSLGWSWKNSLHTFFRRRNSFPTVLAEQQEVSKDLAFSKPAFFREPVVNSSSVSSVDNLDDSPISRLGSHFESISRDVTAMSNAVVRRSQRVARLFSRVDEYVVIM